MVDRLKTPAGWPSILLERAGAADPLDLDAAVRAGAFEGLRRAVRDLGPTATIATISASGLRGRGGAGFPAGEKWRTAASTPASRRYVVANGYGADPATFTDQYLLEHDPYAVIEGVVIAAATIGASEAFIAVRAEATETIRILEAAIGSAEEAGYAGDDVLGSGRRIDRLRATGPGRVHAGRGDRPAQGPRGQARPARTAPTASRRARPVRRADPRPQRPDPRRGRLDRAQRRRGVPGDRHGRRAGHDPGPAPDAGR